jgi:hypothetical protein
MSWMPDQDPVLGDKRFCDALDLVIVPRTRDIGGFEVRRALPHGKRHMVGPFIFFDQMGPVQFIAGAGMDVRPHPHIGLATRPMEAPIADRPCSHSGASCAGS